MTGRGGRGTPPAAAHRRPAAGRPAGALKNCIDCGAIGVEETGQAGGWEGGPTEPVASDGEGGQAGPHRHPPAHPPTRTPKRKWVGRESRTLDGRAAGACGSGGRAREAPASGSARPLEEEGMAAGRGGGGAVVGGLTNLRSESIMSSMSSPDSCVMGSSTPPPPPPPRSSSPSPSPSSNSAACARAGQAGWGGGTGVGGEPVHGKWSGMRGETARRTGQRRENRSRFVR